MNVFPITQAGYDKLREKLNEINKEFQTLPKIIQTARARGDLKENAEYHAAREKQGMLNAHISKINSDLANSRVTNPAQLKGDIVTFGKKVTLRNLNDQTTTLYYILGPAESSFFENGLSISSKVAKGLLAKKEGEEVEIEVPSGQQRYHIEKIEL